MKSTFTLAFLLALFIQLFEVHPCPAADGPGRRKNTSPRSSKKYLRPVSHKAITSGQFQQLSRTHRVIAILPVEVYIAPDAPGPANRALGYRARVEATNLYRVLFAFLQRENFKHANPLKLQDISL